MGTKMPRPVYAAAGDEEACDVFLLRHLDIYTMHRVLLLGMVDARIAVRSV